MIQQFLRERLSWLSIIFKPLVNRPCCHTLFSTKIFFFNYYEHYIVSDMCCGHKFHVISARYCAPCLHDAQLIQLYFSWSNVAQWIYNPLHTADNYRSCAHMSRCYLHTHIYIYIHRHTQQTQISASLSLSWAPYRLIDGDSRVGNPIHRAEDKFHVPQCVSWETRRVAVLVRLRLHRQTMAPTDLYVCGCARVYMYACTRRGVHPAPTLITNRVHRGMAGCRKFLATRIVWIAAPFGSSPNRCSLAFSLRPSVYVSLPFSTVNRVSILSRLRAASEAVEGLQRMRPYRDYVSSIILLSFFFQVALSVKIRLPHKSLSILLFDRQTKLLIRLNALNSARVSFKTSVFQNRIYIL